jgi:hypothetical protein
MPDQGLQQPRRPEWQNTQSHGSSPARKDQPENPLVKWSMITMLSLFAAAILGALFAFYPYFSGYHGKSGSSYARREAREFAQADTVPAMKGRFWLGSGIGGAAAFVGLAWILRKKSGARE